MDLDAAASTLLNAWSGSSGLLLSLSDVRAKPGLNH